jgi:thiol-disulfide isomerase/thioredoxin
MKSFSDGSGSTSRTSRAAFARGCAGPGLRGALLALAVSLAGQPGAAAEGVFGRFVSEGGIAAPAHDLIGPTGAKSLEELRGKWVLLHFWATWCAPCITELPSLDALQRARRDDGLAVVAVSVDRTGPERIANFLTELGVNDLVPYQDRLGLLSGAYKVRSFPSSFLIAPNGRLVGRLEHAADWDSPEAAAFLDRVTGDH